MGLIFTPITNRLLDEALLVDILETVKFLVENGANIHADDESALRTRAQNGHLEVVRFLVDNGANIQTQNETPQKLNL